LKAIRLTRKKSALAVAAILIVLVVCVGVFGLMRFLSGEKEGGTQMPLVSVNDAQAAAMGYARGGDIDGGLAYYDGQIEQRKDANERWLLLLHKSNFAFGVERYKEAVDAAKRADAIKSDLSTFVALARAYEGAGDKQRAVTYYKKALEASPKDGLSSRNNQMWEQKIAELQS
jgi:tetratricopeptide (TPR) repeat protein